VAAPAYAVRFTGAGTFIGGFLHTLPFLIPSYTTAVLVAVLVVMFELATLAFLRMRFFNTSFATSLLNVALAGVIIVGRAQRLDPPPTDWRTGTPGLASKCAEPYAPIERGEVHSANAGERAPTPYRRWLFVSLGRDSPTPPLRNLVGASLADPYVRTLRPMRT